jgi:uncharacterized membrane protein
MAALVAVGGVIFLRFILLPSVRELSEADRKALMERTVGRFRLPLWTAFGLLILTGLYNAGQVAVRGGFSIPLYVEILMVKMLLAFVLFGIAVILTFPGPVFLALKARRQGLLMFNVGLATFIVLLSAALRRM